MNPIEKMRAAALLQRIEKDPSFSDKDRKEAGELARKLLKCEAFMGGIDLLCCLNCGELHRDHPL